MLTYPPSLLNNRILCHYANPTEKIQIIQITNIPNWYFEKVVFPQQRLMFEAFPEALLEIHTGVQANAIVTQQIQCQFLSVNEKVTQLS